MAQGGGETGSVSFFVCRSPCGFASAECPHEVMPRHLCRRRQWGHSPSAAAPLVGRASGANGTRCLGRRSACRRRAIGDSPVTLYFLPASSLTAACASLRAGSVDPTDVSRYARYSLSASAL